MAAIARNEVIDPKTLTSSAKEELITSLYAVHSEIFDGVSREEFGRYVVDSKAESTRIQVSYGESGEIAGYLAMHAFRRELGGEICTITRAEAGLRRKYRGNGSTASFAISQMLKLRWEHSGPTFYLGCLVHPSSYTIFARNTAAVWPSAGVETPAEIMNLLTQLGDEFGLPVVDPARPLVRKVGWITRDTDVERRYWQTSDLPSARFFLEQNPGYGQGHGLLTLVPFDAASLASTVFKAAGLKLKRSVQRAIGSLERGVLKRQLDPVTAEDLLAAAEEISGLDLDSVRAKGLIGTRFPLEARATLFRAGDRADAMYVVVQGSLFVLDDSTPGEEVVIDQLGPNTLVGEVALMTGTPRAATVRAAIDSTLLKLTPDDIAKLLEAEPRLEAELWRRINERAPKS